jgi:hypothetical protein
MPIVEDEYVERYERKKKSPSSCLNNLEKRLERNESLKYAGYGNNLGVFFKHLYNV